MRFQITFTPQLSSYILHAKIFSAHKIYLNDDDDWWNRKNKRESRMQEHSLIG